MSIKRIYLLPEAEVADTYAPPEFNHNEKKIYFTLDARELDVLNHYSKTRTRVYFILQLGYFKAKQQFFKVKFEDASTDVAYILSNFFNDTETQLSGQISRNYINQQKNDILQLFNYKNWLPEFEPQIESHICELLRYYPKCHNALRQLLGYFDSQQIVIPTYRKLQDMFTAAFSAEEKRIKAILLSIPKYKQELLSALIDRDDGISQLNIIRVDQKDFKYTAVKAEVMKAQGIAELYEFTKDFIPTLKLSKNAIRYYADVAEQYTTSRLKRLSKSQQWLHMICFTYNRYQQIMDNLITTFMYHVRATMEAGKAYAEAELIKYSSRMVVDFPKLARFLKWFPTRDQTLTHDTLNQAAYKILPKEQFSVLAEFFDGTTFDQKAAKWEYYAKSSHIFSRYLRPILLAVPFVFYKEDSYIMELIDLLKTHYAKGKSPSELRLPDEIKDTIPKNMLTYLKSKPTDSQINPYLFEFFVYEKIYHQLDRGRLCCNDSVYYCDINCDLVNDALVDDAKKIAAEFGYPKIPIYCDERLDDAIEMLDSTWDSTTEKICSGNNSGLNIKKNKSGKKEWSLLYDSIEPLDDAFFKTLSKVEIADIVMFIGDRVGMWDAFAHMKGRYTKRKKPSKLAINACLLSEAFGFSTMKMAEISDINFNLLKSTREDFI